MSEQVRCLDCKHREVKMHEWISLSAKYRGVCLKSWHPETRVFDPVLGEEVIKGHYDSPGIARLRTEICGPAGIAWEPKHKKDLFKFIKHVSI